MRCGSAGVLVVALLGAAAPAQATEGLAWQWPEGVTRRFALRTSVKLPYVMEFDALRNLDTRISGFRLGLIVDCTPVATVNKQSVEVRCDIDKAAMQATPSPGDRGKLKPILDEWTTLFEAAWVDVVFSSNGRIRSFDLEGVDRTLQRRQDVAVVQREFLVRAFAAFDLQLPKDGTDGGAGQWTQSEGMSFALPTYGTGSLGAVSLLHTVVASQGSVVVWTLEGKGQVASPMDAYQSVRDTFLQTLTGSVTFDTSLGIAVSTAYQATAKPTSSSVSVENGQGLSYDQTTTLVYVAPGTDDPVLFPNQENEAWFWSDSN